MFSFPLIYCHTTPSSIPENQERLKVIKQESPAPERWTPATRLSCLISLGISSFHLMLAHKLLLIIGLVWNKDTALWCLPQLNCKSNRANMHGCCLLQIQNSSGVLLYATFCVAAVVIYFCTQWGYIVTSVFVLLNSGYCFSDHVIFRGNVCNVFLWASKCAKINYTSKMSKHFCWS